jgi:glycosyltransferase involved in cell wall biosynthesis
MTDLARGSKPGFRIALVGASSAPICGVRDHVRVIAEALTAQGAQVETLWWERDESWGLRRLRAEARRWLAAIDETVRCERPDWIIWHYSVFAWGVRGIPFLAPAVARRLARTRVPLLVVLHEFTFPFGDAGIRGRVWALAHRAALVPVWRASAGAIVTTEERGRWLRSRRWLPRRPVLFLPVCSNLPASEAPARPRGGPRVGVFGFATDAALADEVVAAVAVLRARGLEVRLELIGAPGAANTAADTWRTAAARHGFDSLAFTDILKPLELTRALSAVDLVLLADSAGPMSRKTTLAAALALAKPVVAIDGPKRWERLVEAKAVVLTRPTVEALATALERLLRDEAFRKRLGQHGAAFYRRWMAPERLASETLALLGSIAGSDPAVEPVGRSRVVIA